MKGWIRQAPDPYWGIVSFRQCEILAEGDRMVCLCPDTDNVLINCSKPFFDKEVAKGGILWKNPNANA